MARILVIDDDAEVRELIRRILQKAGHEVWEASNGRLGVALCGQRNPDIVITDMLMPEMEGAETIIHIRSCCVSTKIIVISGGDATRNASLCLRVGEMAGATKMLAKPIESADLLSAVRELIKD